VKFGAPAVPVNRYGRSLLLASAGGALGCVLVGAVAAASGLWMLFLAFPPLTVHLVFSALLSAAATAMAARLWRRPISTVTIMAISAALTVLLFSVLPLYFLLLAPGRAGGLLFN